MEEILHQLIGSLSHYLQGFIHPRWLFGISVHQQYERWYSAEGSRVSDFQKPPVHGKSKKISPPSLESNLPVFRLSLWKTTCVWLSTWGMTSPATEDPLSINPRDRDMEREKNRMKTTRDTTPTNQKKTHQKLSQVSMLHQNSPVQTLALEKHMKSDKYYDCWSVWDSHGGL